MKDLWVKRKKSLDPLCMKDVLAHTPAFKNARSLMEKKCALANVIVIMSPKFAAELAGLGCEYDFGMAKYDFRSNSITSLSGFYLNSHNCFRKENITIHKRRRFARKARDYQRAYRAGAMGLEAEVAIKQVKTHRCALDTDTAFIIEHCTEEPLTIVWVD